MLGGTVISQDEGHGVAWLPVPTLQPLEVGAFTIETGHCSSEVVRSSYREKRMC